MNDKPAAGGDDAGADDVFDGLPEGGKFGHALSALASDRAIVAWWDRVLRVVVFQVLSRPFGAAIGDAVVGAWCHGVVVVVVYLQKIAV